MEVRAGGKKWSFDNVEEGNLVALLEGLKIRSEGLSWRSLFGLNEAPEKEAGKMLKAARLGAKLTQAQLGKRLKLKQSNISAMEKGDRVIGRALAKRLGKLFQLHYKTFL